MQFFNKHIIQVKRGGIIVVIKKIRSFIYLILQIPIYLISIPTVIIIRLIRPWFLIRWNELRSARIGHFATNTELYCCKRDARINFPSQRYLDVFYLKKYVCNKQLEKMWRRSLIILPNWLLFPISKVNRFFNIFVPSGNYHEIEHDCNYDRDVHNLLERSQPHLSFTHDEEVEGKRMLTKFGMPRDAKFVCLNVRDSAYLSRHVKYENIDRFQYHGYRDGDIDKFVLAAEELANRGYYIFRMGVKVLKPLKSSNLKIIDYANSGMRSDFMDIYLSAKCSFCISTAEGLAEIPTIFRKPTIKIYTPLGDLTGSNRKDLLITKYHINNKNNKKLTISEIFLSEVALAYHSKKFEQNNIVLEENSPEEIRDVSVEMDERINGSWKETEEDLLLQKKFWSVFTENMKKLNLPEPNQGEIRARFGAKYLRKNQYLIQ